MSEAIALIDKESAVPALDRERFWLALVFNVLIGNCDAHGKNYSLLYYSPAPSLAPLYDLLSTTVYRELTKRLSMSIDGAREINEVDGRAWSRLAAEAGVSPRFLEQRMTEFVERVAGSALELAEEPEFAGPIVEQIVAGIGERAERFRPRPAATTRD